MISKDFTLIEWMVIAVITGILAAETISVITGHKHKQIECRAGYQFDIRSDHQIISSNGGGVPCDVVVKQ